MKWMNLEEAWRILRDDMYDAFANWYNKSNLGKLNVGPNQFNSQMNDILLGRTAIIRRKPLRTSKATGQKAYWLIEPLLNERRKFMLLYENITFDDADDLLTDVGTRPIDSYAQEWIDDYKALSDGIQLPVQVGKKADSMMVDKDGNDPKDRDEPMTDDEEEKNDSSGDEEEDDEDDDDMGGPDDI